MALDKTLAVLTAEAVAPAREAWDLYFRKHEPSGIDGTEGFMEADFRLRLVPIIIRRILNSHTTLLDTFDKNSGCIPFAMQHMIIELQIDTEALYWQCARLRRVLRQLPGLSTFKAQGIRDVRNHLIEHPEGKASGILMMTFGWNPTLGPVIKWGRQEGSSQAFMDAGLFKNTIEFYNELEIILRYAVDRESS